MGISWDVQHERRLQRLRDALDEPPLSSSQTAAFREVIRHYYRSHRRAFPWRNDPSPYQVLVSEVMLQQTQAQRVVEKYNSFVAQFPTIEALAEAPLPDVLRAWQGLGYNRRGKALKSAAAVILEEHAGQVPMEEEALRRLPGIGSYTAAAIRVFAFNHPALVLETNIRTVFTHFFFPRRRVLDDAELLPLIERSLDRRSPRDWYSALMDYGAYLKQKGVRLNARRRGYRPQSTFTGSRRELRGFVLRELSAAASMRRSSLEKRLGRHDERLSSVIAEMTKEGLVTERRGSLRLAQ